MASFPATARRRGISEWKRQALRVGVRACRPGRQTGQAGAGAGAGQGRRDHRGRRGGEGRNNVALGLG